MREYRNKYFEGKEAEQVLTQGSPVKFENCTFRFNKLATLTLLEFQVVQQEMIEYIRKNPFLKMDVRFYLNPYKEVLIIPEYGFGDGRFEFKRYKLQNRVRL